MPVKPSFVERLAVYRLNRAPSAMVDMFDAGSFHVLAPPATSLRGSGTWVSATSSAPG